MAAPSASSEGLRTVIVERDVPGGQAGSSALIENYLGFPDGLSGAELASRAVTQAQKFGTEILLTKSAVSLQDDRGYRVLRLDDGTGMATHTVLLATGVAYRKLTVEGRSGSPGRVSTTAPRRPKRPVSATATSAFSAAATRPRRQPCCWRATSAR